MSSFPAVAAPVFPWIELEMVHGQPQPLMPLLPCCAPLHLQEL